MHNDSLTRAKLAFNRAESARKNFIKDSTQSISHDNPNAALRQKLEYRVCSLCQYLLNHTMLDDYTILDGTLHSVLSEICTSSTSNLSRENTKVNEDVLNVFWSEIILTLPYGIIESIASLLYFFQLLRFHADNLATTVAYDKIIAQISTNSEKQ
jgi:hypothetical protein